MLHDDQPDEANDHDVTPDEPGTDQPAATDAIADPGPADDDDAPATPPPPTQEAGPPLAAPPDATAPPPPPGFAGAAPPLGAPAPAPTAGRPRPQPGPRRLTRSRDRKLGGVAGGIAEYLGIDPTLVRLGFLLAIFIGGAGVIAYIVAWIVLPESDGGDPDPARRPPMRVRRDGRGLDTTTALAIALLVFAVLIGLASPGGGEVLVPVAMIAGGIWLLSQRETSRVGDDDATTSAAFSTAGAAVPRSDDPAVFPVDDTDGFTRRWDRPAADTSGPDDDLPHAAPSEPPPPAVVTRVTLSLVALLTAGAIAADELDLFDVTVAGVLAIGLVLVGAGAIIAAFVGRGRGLIPLGVVMALLFAGAATAQPLVEDGTGQRTYVPGSVADVRGDYRLGIGELDVDLSGLDLAPGETVETTVDLGIGSAEVLVPDDVDVVVDGEVAIGELRIFEFEENGLGNDLRRTRTAEVADAATTTVDDDGDGNGDEPGTLIIRLEVGIGEGVVRNG